MNDFISRVLTAVVVVVLLAGSAVFASDDSPFYFDESGKMQMNGTWSPMHPNSRRTTEEDRRQYNAWANAETLRKNEALVDEYYSPKPSAPPSGSSDYWISGPDGQSQWCRSIAPRRVICQ
ncbi:MAG: hypothetical protein NDI90_21735 [Nitrospira sp. BO4]|nr:hypothetical protein [Nitrospira sp. BO4]